jgi:hypothetical protein
MGGAAGGLRRESCGNRRDAVGIGSARWPAPITPILADVKA